MLAGVLRGVICQQLIPRQDTQGRIAAREILFVTPAVANLIREGNTFQIYSAIQLGASLGMRTMDADIKRLFREGIISRESAEKAISDPKLLLQP